MRAKRHFPHEYRRRCWLHELRPVLEGQNSNGTQVIMRIILEFSTINSTQAFNGDNSMQQLMSASLISPRGILCTR